MGAGGRWWQKLGCALCFTELQQPAHTPGGKGLGSCPDDKNTVQPSMPNPKASTALPPLLPDSVGCDWRSEPLSSAQVHSGAGAATNSQSACTHIIVERPSHTASAGGHPVDSDPFGNYVGNLHAALESAAPSEPTSMVSVGQGNTLFSAPPRSHINAQLLPRVAAGGPSSGQSAYGVDAASGLHQGGAGMFARTSRDDSGRLKSAGDSSTLPPPVSQNVPKLTAASLGSHHATLSDSAIKQQQQRTSSRKRQLIQNWLRGVEGSELTTQPETHGDITEQSALDEQQQADAQMAIDDRQTQQRQSRDTTGDQQHGRARAKLLYDYKETKQGLSSLPEQQQHVYLQDTASNFSGSVQQAAAGQQHQGGHHHMMVTLPAYDPASTAERDTAGTSRGTPPSPFAICIPPPGITLEDNTAVLPLPSMQQQQQPVVLVPAASVLSSHAQPQQPLQVVISAQPELPSSSHQPLLQQSKSATTSSTGQQQQQQPPQGLSSSSWHQHQQFSLQQQHKQQLQGGGLEEPPTPQQQQHQHQQQRRAQFIPSDHNSNSQMMVDDHHHHHHHHHQGALAGTSAISLTSSITHAGVGGGGMGGPRSSVGGGQGDNRDNSVALSAVTMASQAEAQDVIPNRVVAASNASSAHIVTAVSRPTKSPDTTSNLPAPMLRLPSAATHDTTKTIAVAGHCPEDMVSQHWCVDDFILQRKLYEGALSVICQAQHKRSGGRTVALKIYKRSRLHEMERFQLAREICLHIRILHPHVLALYAAWKDSKYVYLVLEWAPHGNLFELLVSRGGKLAEVEAAHHVIRPLLLSLAFLHSQGFIHRDIKLENVLLDAQGQVKLCDFGLAIDQKFEQANTRLGTFGYFAPEVLDCPLKKGPFDYKGEAGVPTYDAKVDVWSATVVAYELLTGKAPFSASSASKIIDAIRHRVVEYPAHLSPGACSFLAAGLVRDPSQRASAKDLLQHPWLVQCCTAAALAAAATAGGAGAGGAGVVVGLQPTTGSRGPAPTLPSHNTTTTLAYQQQQ